MGAAELSADGLNVNILVVGEPLKEEYLELLEGNNIINLGYINWIKDLYKLIDIAVVTDDGMMIQEAIACQLPIIALLGVKYGRYHNLAEIFKGAVLESDLEDITQVTTHAFDKLDELKGNALKYSADVLNASDNIARVIYDKIRDKNKSDQ